MTKSGSNVNRIIVLMGVPGSGKGTQGRLISEQFGWPAISTGDILRDIAKTDTEMGRIVKETQKAGQLVSDEIMAELIQARTARADCHASYVLDGYPRTPEQAALLDRIAGEQGKELIVINIAVKRESLVKRLSGRRSCPRCGEIYNLYLRPPSTDMMCDRCQVPLFHRVDDVPEVVGLRYDTYQERTAPLVEYYRNKGCFFEIDGEGTVEDIFSKLQAILK
jgi:adenylate kinase